MWKDPLHNIAICIIVKITNILRRLAQNVRSIFQHIHKDTDFPSIIPSSVLEKCLKWSHPIVQQLCLVYARKRNNALFGSH